MKLHLTPRVPATLALAAGLLLTLPAFAAAEPAVKAGKATKAQPAGRLEAPAASQGDAQQQAMMAEMMKLAAPGPCSTSGSRSRSTSGRPW